ncbi:MAG: protein phosphatase 2C domain-containing protein [Candidatus Obscuribacterales bacterium]|nr:protein phosphatase 2C domain-containing protein [Candidatus Obscuribacterales bacterium]
MEPCPYLNARRDPCPTREPGDLFCSKCGKEYDSAQDDAGSIEKATTTPAAATIVEVEPPKTEQAAAVAIQVPEEADNIRHYIAPKCVGCNADSSNFDEDGFCTKCWVQAVLPCRDDFFIEVTPNIVARSNLGNPTIGHSRNEDYAAMDSVVVDGKRISWFVVADGVSSSKAPQQASEEACRAASATLRIAALSRQKGSEGLVLAAINSAQSAVLKVPAELNADADFSAPACTIIVAFIDDGVASLGWCGDSRLYAIYRDSTASCGYSDKLLSRDHTLLNEMIDQTGVSAAEAYKKFTTKELHTMTQCLGEVPEGEIYAPSTSTVTIDSTLVSIFGCSDGAWNDVHDMDLPQSGEFAKIFASNPRSAMGFAEAVLKRASGADNNTIAVINF